MTFQKLILDKSEVPYFVMQRRLLKLVLCAYLIVLPLALWGTCDKLYLTREGIHVRHLWPLHEVFYSWDELDTVYAEYVEPKTKGALSSHLILTMADNHTIDLIKYERLKALRKVFIEKMFGRVPQTVIVNDAMRQALYDWGMLFHTYRDKKESYGHFLEILFNEEQLI